MKTVFITGGSSGIGKACVEKFSQEGYNVSLFSRNIEKQKQVVDDINTDNYLLNQGDITNQSDIEEAVNNTLEEFDNIDVLINNAGIGKFGSVEDLDKEDFQDVFDVNLFGLFQVTKEVLQHMKARNQGQIIMISSMAGKNVFPHGSAYAASKWALEGMTGCIQKELRETQVKIGKIQPGSVETPFFSKSGMEPNQERCLTPSDVSDQVYNMAEQGYNSDIDEITIRPAYTPEN